MSVKYIYILSQRYSGSTLLSFLLATHPGISTIGERRKFFAKSFEDNNQTGIRCSCGELFQECPFWRAIKNRFLEKAGTDNLSENFTEFQLFKNKVFNKIAQQARQVATLEHWPMAESLFGKKMQGLLHYNQILVESILELEGNAVFLDSSKVIQQAYFLSAIPDFDLYIVWLTRDPRAQISSALKYNKWSVGEAADRWKKEMVVNKRVLDKMGAKYLELSYESLCRAPREEIGRILQFIGLDADAVSLDFRSQTQHIMGNYAMRLGKDEKIEERKDWLDRLDPAQIRLIETKTKDYRQYYSD